MSNYLEKINSPSDLKFLSEKEILSLNSEIREFLIENVTKTGGHLASNLGVVELTVALHKVFDTPKDRIIFDVGHQSYVHKILTERKAAFSTLRQMGGLSGFTKRSESPYDAFGAGHSSTAISAALGFSEADRICGKDNFTIAVVGDGAFTGGLVYEALNNCDEKNRLIIILNENEMSISKNVGNLSKHISKIRSTKGYFTLKLRIEALLDKLPLVGAPLKRFSSFVKDKLKNAVYNLNFFENMGLHYLGPIDGNDYHAVETLLQEAKRRGGNALIHIKTLKGCGYDKAECNPKSYHGLSPCGECKPSNGTFSSHAGKYLCECAKENPLICAVTAAMSCGTGIEAFEQQFPDRYFDVGIAEGHAVTFFAGLSAAGMKPVFAVYSTFLQRAYDNIIHDVSLQSLGGVFLIDRAGFAHEDGATHHGIFDTAFLSEINGLTVFEPISFEKLGAMISLACQSDGLFAIRYPKGAQNDEIVSCFNETSTDGFDIMTYNALPTKTMPKNVIITYGRIASEALKAAKNLNAKGIPTDIILLQTLKPLERQAELICKLLSRDTEKIAFLEEGLYEGGIAMLLREKLFDFGTSLCHHSKIFAIRGEIPEQAPLCELYKQCGISHDDIESYIASAEDIK